MSKNTQGTEENELIKKEAVLYVFRPETQYTCNKCVFAKDKSTKCALFGPTESIKSYGGCNYWIHSSQQDQISWIGTITKVESGYMENEQGFSCKRCEYFLPNNDCQKVDKNSEGDTPGIISPNGCCGNWDADDTRAKMTTEQLNKLLASR